MANIFPRWTNLLPIKIAICIGSLALCVVAGFSYYATPKAQRVGYMPDQPIPYDHELHVKELGLDCRYCHSFVDQSGHANIPSANTCWNCHQHVKRGSEKLAPLRAALGLDKDHNPIEGAKRTPIRWARVHKTPDYAFFDHSAHVNRGVSCVSCHGQVNEMPVVYHAESLSMEFCLDCHRAPEKHLRPLEEVYNLDYDPKEYLAEHHAALGVKDFNANWSEKKAQLELGNVLKQKWSVTPRTSCATCHH